MRDGVAGVFFVPGHTVCLSPYRSINHLLQKSEVFQSVHHVTFILCYTVLYNFLGLRCRSSLRSVQRLTRGSRNKFGAINSRQESKDIMRSYDIIFHVFKQSRREVNTP